MAPNETPAMQPTNDMPKRPTILIASPKHTNGSRRRYIVWHDGSLRRVDKLIKKHFSHMTEEQQDAMVLEAERRAGGIA